MGRLDLCSWLRLERAGADLIFILCVNQGILPGLSGKLVIHPS